MSTQKHTPGQALLGRLRHHVTGAIERGEAVAIVGVPAKAAHTPGPWNFTEAKTATGDTKGIWVYAEKSDDEIAFLERNDPPGLDEANARLIAAAPELLAEGKATDDLLCELLGLVQVLRGDRRIADSQSGILIRATAQHERNRAAIANAEGAWRA